MGILQRLRSSISFDSEEESHHVPTPSTTKGTNPLGLNPVRNSQDVREVYKCVRTLSKDQTLYQTTGISLQLMTVIKSVSFYLDENPTSENAQKLLKLSLSLLDRLSEDNASELLTCSLSLQFLAFLARRFESDSDTMTPIIGVLRSVALNLEDEDIKEEFISIVGDRILSRYKIVV